MPNSLATRKPRGALSCILETKLAIDEIRIRRALWRAHHRGTKEADMMVGGFADRWIREMDEDQFTWFEQVMEEQDVDIMAWAFGKDTPPAELEGPMMDRLRSLDYLKLVPR